MGFMDAVKLFYSNYTKFDGRSRRSEYWWPQLFIFLVAIAGMILAGILGNISGALAGIISLLLMVFYLGSLLPAIAVMIRRMHDVGKPAIWCLLALIPFGGLVLLYFFVQEGTQGPNEYGPDPKGGAGGVVA